MATSVSARRNVRALLGFLILCFGVGALSSIATSSSVATWYPTLAKPPWTPPSWLFGPVWTALYAAMGVAVWLVWRTPAALRGTAFVVFLVQLTLNGAWSWFFFGFRHVALGALDLVALWLALAATIAVFRRVSRIAAWLLVPCLVWVTYAAALNTAIWQLNP